MRPEIERYLSTIRNPWKRSYAREYYLWKRAGLPDEPEPINLGYMAAQAVRIKIAELLMLKW